MTFEGVFRGERVTVSSRRAKTFEASRVESNVRTNEESVRFRKTGDVSTNMKSFSKMRVATGVALGAVLALSYVDSALGAVTASSTACSGVANYAGATLNTVLSGAACACDTGYAEFVTGPDTTTDGTLTCIYCADGYYLKTPGATGTSECAPISSKLDSTTVPAARADTTNTGLSADAVQASPLNKCAANHYGTATDFDGTGCTACPANSEVAAAAGGGLATCLTKAGYILTTGHASTSTSVVVTQLPPGVAFVVWERSKLARYHLLE